MPTEGLPANRRAREQRGADSSESPSLGNLNELRAPDPVAEGRESPTLGGFRSTGEQPTFFDTDDDTSVTTPRDLENLDELAVPSPLENPREQPTYRHHDLEEVRSAERRGRHSSQYQQPQLGSDAGRSSERPGRMEALLKRLHLLSHLVFFAILGTLARLGLQALTIYPGAPVALGELWANAGGSAVMGFLSEDRALFRKDLELAADARRARDQQAHADARSPPSSEAETDAEKAALLEDMKQEFTAVKKGIPLYVGLTVGFCGSFTTFSSLIRDVFLALSNDLDVALTSSAETTSRHERRNDGYSVAAMLAVLIIEISVCLAAVDAGAHIAMAVEPALGRVPRINARKLVDPLVVCVAWSAWLGAVVMAIWPPDRFEAVETWRGQAVFALVFAPAGCLLRFYLSLWLNGLVARFPFGTFAANMCGTMVLGLCWDLQHADIPVAGGAVGGGLVGCQVLQGVQDGFCGCLTTVSTWMMELKGLRRVHAYVYGVWSVGVALGMLVVIMGTLRWTEGFAAVVCVT